MTDASAIARVAFTTDPDAAASERLAAAVTRRRGLLTESTEMGALCDGRASAEINDDLAPDLHPGVHGFDMTWRIG